MSMASVPLFSVEVVRNWRNLTTSCETQSESKLSMESSLELPRTLSNSQARASYSNGLFESGKRGIARYRR